MKERTRTFSLVELLVVISVLAILASLLLNSLTRVQQQSDSLLCQSKLRYYSTAYGLYLDDNHDLFPYQLRYTNGRLIKDASIHWALVVWRYKDYFDYQTSMNDTPSIQCPTFKSLSYEFPFNYRGYTGVHLKNIHDLNHNPSSVGLIGDGVTAWPDRGYAFHTINGISEKSLQRPAEEPRDKMWGQFHSNDFLHAGHTVNTAFADLHIENLDPFTLIENQKQIWDR